jgi:choline dehydrogenase-like flavoprotein
VVEAAYRIFADAFEIEIASTKAANARDSSTILPIAVPQKGLNGRIGYQPRGKGLGGSSAINAMVYIRGHRADYDQWASLGSAGWSFADVLPYFKRAENNADFDGEYHGKGGPLAVNKSRTGNPVQQIFLQAAQEAQFRLREALL